MVYNREKYLAKTISNLPANTDYFMPTKLSLKQSRRARKLEKSLNNGEFKPTRKKLKPNTYIRPGELDRLLKESAAEVEAYFFSLHKEDEQEDFGCSIRDMEFAKAFINCGFKMAPAIAASLPGADKKTKSWQSVMGRFHLNKPKVSRYIAKQLYNRRVAADVTHDWVTKKYRMWSEIDPTEFFEVVEVKPGKYSILLKKELKKLPKHVRTSIKALSSDPKTGSIKVEFVDQKGALDQLCKLLGFTNEKLLNLDMGEVHLHFDKQDEGA